MLNKLRYLYTSFRYFRSPNILLYTYIFILFSLYCMRTHLFYFYHSRWITRPGMAETARHSLTHAATCGKAQRFTRRPLAGDSTPASHAGESTVRAQSGFSPESGNSFLLTKGDYGYPVVTLCSPWHFFGFRPEDIPITYNIMLLYYIILL